MASSILKKPSESEFIYFGLTKDKWPHVTIELVQGFLDDPASLDNEENNSNFVERFYYYYDWYWNDNR